MSFLFYPFDIGFDIRPPGSRNSRSQTVGPGPIGPKFTCVQNCLAKDLQLVKYDVVMFLNYTPCMSYFELLMQIITAELGHLINPCLVLQEDGCP